MTRARTRARLCCTLARLAVGALSTRARLQQLNALDVIFRNFVSGGVAAGDFFYKKQPFDVAEFCLNQHFENIFSLADLLHNSPTMCKFLIYGINLFLKYDKF